MDVFLVVSLSVATLIHKVDELVNLFIEHVGRSTLSLELDAEFVFLLTSYLQNFHLDLTQLHDCAVYSFLSRFRIVFCFFLIYDHFMLFTNLESYLPVALGNLKGLVLLYQ